MEPFGEIRAFLGGVRRRLLQTAALTATLLGGAALAVAGLVCAIVAARLDADGSLARPALAVALGVVVAVVLTAGVIRPRRRLHDDRDVARQVGRRAPAIASDLLSAVELERAIVHRRELGDEAAARARLGFSIELARALAIQTSRRARALDPSAIVPWTGVRGAARLAGAAVLLHVLALAAAPRTIVAGWRHILSPPSPGAELRGAVAAHQPIVGDISLTLSYPAYTRRAPVTTPASTGDVLAPRGTRVTIETTALRPAARARIVFDGRPETAAVPMEVDGRTLRASLVVERPEAFRFVLEPAAGRPIAEALPHRIELELDRAPQVELYVPAEELEVSSRRQVEIAWSVEDDYGVAGVALVWRSGSGAEQRKALPPPRPGARTAQGRLLWDLSEVALEPGSQVAYRVEAVDNDDVAGPNVGSSRTYHLRLFSPLERHRQVLARLEAALEAALVLLADRLEQPADALDRTRAAHAAAQRLVADLGALAAAVAEDGLAPKRLRPELEAVHKRLDKLTAEEEDAVEAAVARAARPDPAPRTPGPALDDLRQRHVGELERDVLILDDWVQRQRLEEILAVSDEIRQHRERLQALLEDYAQARSEQARAEIEREMKALEQRLAELTDKLGRLRGAAEDRFVNADALAAADPNACLARVRARLEAGDAAGAATELEACGRALDAQAQALEAGLRSLRGEKFSEEERAFSEVLDEVSDLARDQARIVEEAERVVEEYKRRAAEVVRERADPGRERARRALEALRKELAGVPREGLTPFSLEEMENLSRRMDDVGRMLDEGDLAEALAMAEQGQQSLRTLAADLEDDLADGEPWSDRTEEALDKVARADPLLEGLLAELRQATPSPEQILGEAERRKLEELRRRQGAIKDRTARLGGKIARRAEELPGRLADLARETLGEAGQRMGRSERRLGAGDPVSGAEEARGAAEKLDSLRSGMQRGARPSTVDAGGRGPSEEPVRIPGSADHRPPEEFREDILEAMKKERAPEAYRDLVRRYYEELVK